MIFQKKHTFYTMNRINKISGTFAFPYENDKLQMWIESGEAENHIIHG